MAHAALRQLNLSFEGQAELVSTGYAGHAREVAERWASEHLDGTIIGIGGDGTLNEIANGILAAAAAFGSRVVLVVCAGGNANDQYRSWPTSRRVRPAAMLSAQPAAVDVLELCHRVSDHEQAMPQYALSYAAIGSLATGASVVNGRRRGMLADLALFPQTLLRARPVSVVIDGTPTRADSLSWHIIPTIAKVFRVSANSQRADGLMEVVLIRHRRLPTALRMSWFGLRALVWPHRPSQTARTNLFWEHGGVAQLDGETIDIAPRSAMTVRCVPRALRMLCCEIDVSVGRRR